MLVLSAYRGDSTHLDYYTSLNKLTLRQINDLHKTAAHRASTERDYQPSLFWLLLNINKANGFALISIYLYSSSRELSTHSRSWSRRRRMARIPLLICMYICIYETGWEWGLNIYAGRLNICWRTGNDGNIACMQCNIMHSKNPWCRISA